jgi:hypothetical protein
VEYMLVAKSERFSQRPGVARTVKLMPGHTARVFEDRRGTGVLTLGSGILPLCASVRTRVNSRRERSDLSEQRIQPPADQFYYKVRGTAGLSSPMGSGAAGRWSL